MAGPAVEGADDADRASSSAENADSAEGDDGANEGYQQNEAAMNTKESKNWAKIMSKRLMNEIENFLVMKKPEANISFQINKEFATFEVPGGRPDGLNFLYEALNTIPPASVESEKAFSAA